MQPQLRGALEATAARDLASALPLALDAWREVRAPEVGDLIDALSAHLDAPEAARDAASWWRARACALQLIPMHPVEREDFLQQVHGVPGWRDAAPALADLDGRRIVEPPDAVVRGARLAALAALPSDVDDLLRAIIGWRDDPRLATAITCIIDARLFLFPPRWEPEAWGACAEWLLRLRDARALTALRAALARWNDAPPALRASLDAPRGMSVGGAYSATAAWLARTAEGLALADAPRAPLDADTRARFEAAAAALRATPTPSDLRRAERLEAMRPILSARTERAPREAFGRWLRARGDAWGGLFASQLEPDDATPDATRCAAEQELVDACVAGWLGPLASIGQRWEFAGGMPHACTLRWPRGDELPALVEHPLWATVREVAVPPAALGDALQPLCALLRHPCLRGVREAWVGEEALLAALAEGPAPLPWTSLSFSGNFARALTRGSFPEVEAEEVIAAVSESVALPRLKRVTVSTMTMSDCLLHSLGAARFRWLLRSPLARRLRLICFDGPSGDALDAWLAELADAPGVTATVLLKSNSRWGWRLSPGAAPGRFVVEAIQYEPEFDPCGPGAAWRDLHEALDAVDPARIERLTLQLPEDAEPPVEHLDALGDRMVISVRTTPREDP